MDCNLVMHSYALKFTESGHVHVMVSHSTREDNAQYLNIDIEDTGMGIKEKDQSKLFKLFGFINETQKKNVNGIGLGLAISDSIVKQLGGEMRFKSKFGVGSTFGFTVKLEEVE